MSKPDWLSDDWWLSNPISFLNPNIINRVNRTRSDLVFTNGSRSFSERNTRKINETHLTICQALHIHTAYVAWRHTPDTQMATHKRSEHTYRHTMTRTTQMHAGDGGGTGLLLGCMRSIAAERAHQAWVFPAVSAPFQRNAGRNTLD